MTRYLSLTTLIGFLALTGCGGSDGRVAVSGTVKFQGKPLDRGTIQFHPTDLSGKAQFSGADIVDGQYSVPANKGLVPGKYKVMISSPDAIEKEESAPGESGPPAKDRIPRKYNADSQEYVEVKSTGENKFDFDIK